MSSSSSRVTGARRLRRAVNCEVVRDSMGGEMIEQEEFAVMKIQAEALLLIAKELGRIADFFQMFIDAWEEADDESRT